MSDQSVDNSRRNWMIATGAVGGTLGLGAGGAFVSTFAPSERAKAAGAPVEVDLSDLKPGDRKIAEWRGNPVWVIKLTDDMKKELDKVNSSELADPESKNPYTMPLPEYCQNKTRSRKEDVLVMVGICSHLGCSPSGPFAVGANVALENNAGFVCPCHGSTFDLAGRVFKNKPAPKNLDVPRYMYLSETKLVLGKDEKGEA
ncbi:ubiquinol-cytochrome c reductase iron-sulfur subunit [Parvibium lacunae]|uniref:Ubiquinol-cytochrome c reductase iron-sulfur subunit n=1 Tax=Parvibium lacunae TaxID=1888893 RepID=A0A368L4R4_9BURK|nr:ubiquinol-cytochrome c reductase iron-sulfur subunit [Parvibium lacunae]RCS58564.1 ubiquinol-cytochrome c reductase iron-sulfur subunit [Parvibium lacunae]